LNDDTSLPILNKGPRLSENNLDAERVVLGLDKVVGDAAYWMAMYADLEDYVCVLKREIQELKQPKSAPRVIGTVVNERDWLNLEKGILLDNVSEDREAEVRALGYLSLSEIREATKKG
jgi:hypothetical protein